ncbi:hypothetical protein [Zooshikella ganghwensis]|uniref:hypothetical protein n=1 Tax=Zooshikella ganghwensis TaxID=202772 RepID=UPI000412F196|nr:hypothetical protein [Zooshikella ganghwensis]
MNQEKIIQEAVEYLRQHINQHGTRGYIDQEPYKGDWFKLFKVAYINNYLDGSSTPCLASDSFRSILVDRWFDGDRDDEKTELLEMLINKWTEWKYAWDNYTTYIE